MDVAGALRVLVRTIERGSLSAAARDLGVSQPAVTKALRNLEKHVGARLLERSSRAVRPTPQGELLYEASRAGLAAIDSALEGVRSDMRAIEGPLRLHAPSCLGAKHFHRIVMEFREKHPGVTVDLVLENRSVDLIYENVDVAVKYGTPVGQDLIVRKIGLVRRIMAASPAYLARTGPIDRPEQLTERAIFTTPAVSPRNSITLQRAGQMFEIPIRPILRTDNADAIVNTLLDGYAAGPAQHLFIAEHLKSGSLVRILDDYEVRPTEAFLVYTSVRFIRPAVRAFIDFALPALRAIDGIDPLPTSRARVTPAEVAIPA